MARSLVRLCEAPHFHREISENASRRILERHTWSHYMNGLLQTMERDFGYVVRRSS
jgi:spore maturation protein CgeB